MSKKKNLFEKIGKAKINVKPILKKSQTTLKIQEPRELPADYQSPYMTKEIKEEKRRMFFS